MVSVHSTAAGICSDTLPSIATRDELTRIGSVEEFHSTHPCLLVELPFGMNHQFDSRNPDLFKWNCGVYILDHGVLARRFVIHATDQAAKSTGLRVARWMAHLWSISDDHFGSAPTRLRSTTIDVWLTRSGDPGGEQNRSNIYIYDLGTDRTPIEWVRELSHEYGHFLLPGASGYSEPENWSNGILGERLFILWANQAIKTQRILDSDLPFVTLKEIEEYCTLQPLALISQFQSAGPDRTKLRGADKSAMNAFTALSLYLDQVYGSQILTEILDFLPTPNAQSAHGPDFLEAFQRWQQSQVAFSTILRSGENQVYLAKGDYLVSTEKGAPIINVPSAVISKEGSNWRVRVKSAGWKALHVSVACIYKWKRL